MDKEKYMNYAMLSSEGIIENIIVADHEFAQEQELIECQDGWKIGDKIIFVNGEWLVEVNLNDIIDKKNRELELYEKNFGENGFYFSQILDADVNCDTETTTKVLPNLIEELKLSEKKSTIYICKNNIFRIVSLEKLQALRIEMFDLFRTIKYKKKYIQLILIPSIIIKSIDDSEKVKAIEELDYNVELPENFEELLINGAL